MSRFGGSKNKEVPAITSSSLSDIVFMLLFFFMVTTQLRETENKVIVKLPEASEVVKLETPTKNYQAQFGTDARIQLNDSFKSIDDIRDFIAAERESMSEGDRSFMQTVIRADEDVRMGIITDVKQELRRCSALKIMYASRKTE